MEILNIQDAKKYISDISPKTVVFVTGVTGQDGSHMSDYLLKNTDALIIGGARRLSIKNHENIKHLEGNKRFILVNFDLTDTHSISKTIELLQPDYFINLAAQSFVGSSWDFPIQTWQCNTAGVIHILEAIRQHKPDCRFYNAGSSEEFGNVEYAPQDEKHPYKPRSPYGASKVAARQIVKVYRESYGLYAIQGLLFNHEGTRRGEEFVTRKITKAVAKIKKSLLDNKNFEPLELGNVDAKRDWSDAEDFVDGIWKMLNQDSPKEYILSSDETHTVREFVELAFKAADINGSWEGKDESARFIINDEDKAKYKLTDPVLVKINPKFYRPAEVDLLLGDSTLARKELKWKPKTNFKGLVQKMIEKDLELEI